jgi:hypothetical protein
MEPLYSTNGAPHSPPTQSLNATFSDPPQVPHNMVTGSLSQVLNAEFVQGGAALQAPESGSTKQGLKRRRTDNSRAIMSYPRKRAVTACQLCRHRKTKCNNERPKCKLCADVGADCVYEDRADHSSYVGSFWISLNQFALRLPF